MHHVCCVMNTCTVVYGEPVLRELLMFIPVKCGTNLNEIHPAISVSCDCCVLSGRGLCDGLITRPEESYRM